MLRAYLKLLRCSTEYRYKNTLDNLWFAAALPHSQREYKLLPAVSFCNIGPVKECANIVIGLLKTAIQKIILLSSVQ